MTFIDMLLEEWEILEGRLTYLVGENNIQAECIGSIRSRLDKLEANPPVDGADSADTRRLVEEMSTNFGERLIALEDRPQVADEAAGHVPVPYGDADGWLRKLFQTNYAVRDMRQLVERRVGDMRAELETLRKQNAELQEAADKAAKGVLWDNEVGEVRLGFAINVDLPAVVTLKDDNTPDKFLIGFERHGIRRYDQAAPVENPKIPASKRQRIFDITSSS